MEITINRKKIQLQFGVRFLRELDKTDGMEIQGQQYGFAIQTALPKLEGYDPVTLANVIHAAAYKASPRPSFEAIDDYLDTVEDLEGLFNEIRGLIESSNAIKLASKKLKEISTKNPQA